MLRIRVSSSLAQCARALSAASRFALPTPIELHAPNRAAAASRAGAPTAVTPQFSGPIWAELRPRPFRRTANGARQLHELAERDRGVDGSERPDLRDPRFYFAVRDDGECRAAVAHAVQSCDGDADDGRGHRDGGAAGGFPRGQGAGEPDRSQGDAELL